MVDGTGTPPAPCGAGDRPLLAGVELGGTKCVATLTTGPDTVLDQQTVPTTTPSQTLGTLADVLGEWRRRPGFAALGVASFGPLDLAPGSPGRGRILATAKPGWPGTDVLGALSAPPGLPVGFDTDVNGAALAEMRWGAGRGLDHFAYVTVGTGIGVGLVVHGRPIRGLGHSEVGHLRVPRTAGDDLPSACPYHPDCAEGLASGTALAARLGGRAAADVPSDDPVWEPVVHALAAMLHALVCTAAPTRVAIGGGVVARRPELIARIEGALVESLGGYVEVGRGYLVPPTLGATAGPLGAVALAADALAGAS